MFGQSTRLRRLMSEKGILFSIGAGTALEAKLMEMNGFDFIWSSRLEISSTCVVPDASE